MFNQKIILLSLFILVSVLFFGLADQVLANDYSQTIVLEPGWNIVSTPRVVESHEFSAPETLENFSIYLLDPSAPSSWTTMAGLGQTEFTPLFGYFIKNDTGVDQTLVLNYSEDVSPDDRLFDRELIPGWNVVGIANPSYALEQYASSNTDTNNPSQILVSLANCAELVVDLTAGEESPSSVFVSDVWDSKIFTEVNSMNDFRETKAYAVYISETCLYQGLQNNDPISTQGSVSVNVNGPASQDIRAGTDNVVFANVEIFIDGADVLIDNLQLYLFMGTANESDNLTNFEIVDTANNIQVTTSNPVGSNVTHVLNFTDINLSAGVNYYFEIRADVPSNVTDGQTYQLVANPLSTTARWQPSGTAVSASEVSYNSLAGSIMTVATPVVVFSKVTTSNATYVENADNVLLFKGKIIANSVDNLKVSKVRVYTGTATTLANIGVAFNKIYLYKNNGDGTETLLDSETSLSGASHAAFSGFTLDIPKGISNGVNVIVRGDVKDNPTTGDLSLRWSIWSDVATTTAYTVRDSDNNALSATSPTQYMISGLEGQKSTISGMGTFTMGIDTELSGLNNNKNVLAGSEVLLGRLKMTAANEAVTLEDLTLQNMGSATINDVAYLRIYEEQSMTTLLGEASFSSKKAMFEDVNIYIPTTGITYLYIAGIIKPIDYSNSPGPDSTAIVSRTVRLSIASTTGYTVKSIGVSTGETLSNNNGIASTTATNMSTIMGAVLSNITTDFANGTLTSGVNKKLFSFKVTVPSSINIDYDGIALPVKLATTTFNVSTSSAEIGALKVERSDGVGGMLTAYYGKHAASVVNSLGEFTINFRDTFASNLYDLEVAPGDTATFNVYGTIFTDGSSESVQIYIDDAFDTDMTYTHNTGTSGADAGDAISVYPLISGITDITGGTLSN